MAKEKTITEFEGWEDQAEQHVFFGETEIAVDPVEEAVKDAKETIVQTTESTEKKSEQEDEDETKIIAEQFKEFEDGFTPSGEEDNEEDEDENKQKNPQTASTSKPTNLKALEFLKEKGLVKFEVEDGKTLTEEEAEGLIEDSWEAGIEEALDQEIKELPEEVKNLIKYATKGGNVGELLSKMVTYATSPINKNSDISLETTQIAAITADLRSQDFDQEYIDTQIEFLKDSGKLATIGEKAYNKIVAAQEKEIQQEVQNKKAEVENNKIKAREYKLKVTNHVNSLTEVGGLPLSKEDKKILPIYISEPTVELKDGRFVSELQADIFKAMSDPNKIVLLAKLVKSDFDFSAVVRRGVTQQSNEVKKVIQNADKTALKSSETVRNVSKKSLADRLY